MSATPVLTIEEFIAPWRDFAACQGADWDTFFPGRGDSVERAKSICATCPVIEPCREYAITNVIREGVFGGMSERERRRERHQRVRERCGLPRLPDRIVDPIAIAEARIGIEIAPAHRAVALWPAKRAPRRVSIRITSAA